MIYALVIIAGLIISFHEKIHLFQRPRTFVKILVVMLLLVIACLSWYNDYVNDVQTEHSAKIADSLSQSSKKLLYQVDSLKTELKNAKIEIENTVKFCSQNTNEEIKETAYRMTKIFAETSKKNIDEHKTTQNKIDSNKLKPPHIQFISEPHNCFKMRFANDTMTFGCSITNSGDMVAYKLRFSVSILIQIDTFYVKFLITKKPRVGDDLAAEIYRGSEFSFPCNKKLFDTAKSFYCVVDGYYFSDEELKINKRFTICTKLSKTSNEPYSFEPMSYDLDKSIEDFVKSAYDLKR